MKTAWRARWPWIAAGLVALWALAWFGAPPLVKSQIEKVGTQALGRELRIETIELTPRLLALTLGGVRIAAAPEAAAPGSADDGQPLLQIERLHLDMHMRSLWRLAPVLEAVEVSAPKLRLTRLADGRYDVDDLIQRFRASEAPADAEPARFALFNLQLRDGELVFDDRPVDRTHRLSGIQLDLPFLSNLPDDLQIKVEPRLAFVVNGTAIDIGGTTTPFAEGRRSAFEIRFDHLPLEAWWAYWPRQLPVQGSGGELDAALTLNFEQPVGGAPRVALQGRIDIDDLALRGLDEQELLRWRKLSVTLDEVRPLERQVALQTVRLEGARLNLRRDAAGTWNIAMLQQPGEQAVPGDSVGAAASAAVAASSAATAGQATAPALKFSLGKLELDDARIDFADASTRPSAEVALHIIELSLADLKWPVEGDSTLALRSRVVVADTPVGDVLAQGALSDRHAKIDVQLQDLQLASAGPYLRQWLRPRLSGKASADAHIDWVLGAEPRQTLVVSTLRLVDLALSDLPSAPSSSSPSKRNAKLKSTAQDGPLAALALLEVSDLRADLLQRQVSVGLLQLQRPDFGLDRDANGKLNVEEWFAAAPTGEAGAAAAQASPRSPQPTWRAELTELKIDGGRVRFKDALGAAQVFELSALQAGAESLAWPLVDGAPPLNTRLSAQLAPPRRPGAARAAADGQPATLQWTGQVTLAPASAASPSMVTAAKGQLRVERLPVHAFEAYFVLRVPVRLQRAEAGFNGSVDLRRSGQSLVGELRGDALLADVRVAMRDDAPSPPSALDAPAPDRAKALADPAQLLSWNAMSLDGLSVVLRADAKPRVEIAELHLSDYFARLEITEEGRLNLQNVAPAKSTTATSGPAAASAAGGESGVRLRGQPIDLVLGSAQLSNGRVAFEDRFVRPNYRAQLSELNGRIGRFDSSTREMATLKFNGVVAGTGALAIEGAINPIADPPALDITAKATDIELPGLTPYASKYAGYPIERGKLSIDVTYKIDEQGKLEARNKIIVNQLTLGPKSDSPNATSLPVRLAVALLQDRNGVIDIDLPLSGSIDDPQFSLGGLILKAIVNLLTKVVTAPFSLLGGGGGGGDGKDLSRIEFEPGSATLVDGASSALDKVAQALADRPALNLSVSGQADARTEAPAMQRVALEQRLRDEQRRERARASLGSSADADAPLPPLSAAQRAQLVERLYAQSPAARATAAAAAGAASAVAASASAGAPAALTVAEMESRLAAAVTVDAAAERALAVQRASAVREALIAKGLSRERLFLAEPGSAAKVPDNQPRGPSALLTLAPR